MEQKNSVSNLGHSLLWFGAAVSIAEIATGVLIAPLGLEKGMLAILIGHLIGTGILYLAGYIGARSKLPAIESTGISFGKYGSYLFSVLNILQLLGWTAIMVIYGARAMRSVTQQLFGFQSEAGMCVLIGLLISIWILVGIKKLDKVNVFAVGGLFVITVILSFIIFNNPSMQGYADMGAMTFGGAVELSAIMPLSWLPLIGDYTRYSKSEKGGPLVSAISYFVGSCWMYAIGLGAALYTGDTDIANILLSAGMGIAALIIVIFSTVTTTFLDVYSAAVSFLNIRPKTNEKAAALTVCVLGTAIAAFVPIERYESFLYLIGSVFAPLFAILLTEYFILKKEALQEDNPINWQNLILWIVGVIIYRFFMQFDFYLGITLPVMLINSILYIILWRVQICLKKS